jgi:hypothetical protein
VTRLLLLLLAACGVASTSCRREDRDYRPAAPFAESVRFAEDYERNAFALSASFKPVTFFPAAFKPLYSKTAMTF